MYAAYATEEVVSKLPFDATCIASYNKKDKLLIGSKQGHLLCCARSPNGKKGFEYQVSRTFEKRLILELKVVESHDLILCLTADFQVTAHMAAEPFTLVDTISKYRPITAFAHFVHEQEKENNLVLAVASKKRLYIFKWQANNFEEDVLSIPLYLADNAQRLAWCNETALVFSLRSEYFYVKIVKDEVESDEVDDVGKPRTLIKTSNRAIDMPLIIDIPALSLTGLCRDSVVVCITRKGMYSCECRFSDTPLALAYDKPYLIAVLPKNIVEIRTIQPLLLIQKIVLDGASTICSGSTGYVYVGSDRSSWMLNSMLLLNENVKFLAEENQLELAVTLANQNSSVLSANFVTELNRKMAFSLFVEKKFAECFNIHLKIDTDVLLVINFLSFLIPEKYLSSLSKYSTAEQSLFEPDTTNLSEAEKKLAILALGDYLSAKRTEYAQMLSKHYKGFHKFEKQNLLPTKVLKKFEAILELLDTVLLKCYILTKPMLVPSLLRLPDNSCIISEAEKDLFSNSKFSELLILYERKRMHKKALDLLLKESKHKNSSLFGVYHLADYLQSLSENNLKLIFDYAPSVFAEDINLGVQIFTGNSETVALRNLDHDEVYQFLSDHYPAAVIPYLEHIIYKLHEQRPKFHDILSSAYISEVKRLIKDYVHTLSDDEFRTRGGDEEGDLGILRKFLIRFLEFSKEYDPKKVLEQLNDYLLEEKAILYGRLKEHEKALCIYANILMDYEAAERHCFIHYNPNDLINSQVFFNLFKMYAVPDNFLSLDFLPRFARAPQANITEALKILRKHAGQIDTVRAISLIPMDTPLSKVWEALEAVFEAIKNKATETNVFASITERAVQRYVARLQKLKMQFTLIDYNVECNICKKKIMTCAFVRLPDFSIAHFFCYKKSDSENEIKKNKSKHRLSLI